MQRGGPALQSKTGSAAEGRGEGEGEEKGRGEGEGEGEGERAEAEAEAGQPAAAESVERVKSSSMLASPAPRARGGSRACSRDAVLGGSLQAALWLAVAALQPRQQLRMSSTRVLTSTSRALSTTKATPAPPGPDMPLLFFMERMDFALKLLAQSSKSSEL